MTKQTIQVIAAIVDEKQLTLWKPDGTTFVVLQGDERLAQIVKEITPKLAADPNTPVTIEIGEEVSLNPYKDYEEASKGKISLFKMAKTRLSALLARTVEAIAPSPPISPMSVGQVPSLDPGHSIFVESNKQPDPVDTSPLLAQGGAARLMAAADEIIQHAQPVSSPDFHDHDVGETGSSTVVAIVKDEKGVPTVVDGIEKIKPQLVRAVKRSSTKGVDAFMQRVAAVAAKRRHSVEDLLKFLEKGDLPIADDGTIVIYKVLRSAPNKPGVYVDCHTRKVHQRVGSYVCMDEALVDANRHTECSNGLHVARRSYIGGFSGDVIVLAKVRPEDVIAVPTYDASKMRVCGYHILFELSKDACQKLRSNRPFTDTDEAKQLLGRALSGDHEPPIEEVRITEQMGGGVKITPLDPQKNKKSDPSPAKAKVKAEVALPDEPDSPLSAPKVNPKAIAKEVSKEKAKVETRSQVAQRLHGEFKKAKSKKAAGDAAQKLLNFKKSAKLGWSALGLPTGVDEELKAALAKN